jgi:DNA-binding transcriptional LysR family regulator
MSERYGRDLDLNLLRVFTVVAETGSVTQAAAKLYLTQPAVSAALRRLVTAIGAPLFARRGRGLALTSRGERLLADLRPHLQAIVDAALAPARFEARSSERTHRIGLSDTAERWLLPALVKVLGRDAPRMRIVAVPVTFRSVGESLLERRIDAAVTVADELAASILRRPLVRGNLTCLFDPRHAAVGKRRLTERAYFEHEHVIVSYNADLRGVIEDQFHKTRRVRCSVASFANLGAIVLGTPLLATVPGLVAEDIRRMHPVLRTTAAPFRTGGGTVELLWPAALEDDDAARWLRDRIVAIAETTRKTRMGAPAR